MLSDERRKQIRQKVASEFSVESFVNVGKERRTATYTRVAREGRPGVAVVWNGVSYPSIRAASRATGKSVSAIREALGRIGNGELQVLREEVKRLMGERLLMAKLAADTPQFYNPLDVYQAKQLRDRILKAGG